MPIDRRRYPRDWKHISHFVRFIRARGLCEVCGAKHGQPHPITGKKVKLQTAHLNRTPEETSLEQLRSICARCHFAYDRPDNQAKRRYGRLFKQLQLALFDKQNNPQPGGHGLYRFTYIAADEQSWIKSTQTGSISRPQAMELTHYPAHRYALQQKRRAGRGKIDRL